MKRTRQSGSAVIEAVIGAAIVSLALATMLQAVVDTASRNRLAEDKRMASLVAQSELATVGSLVPVEPGVTSGIVAGYRWHIQIEPFNGNVPQTTAGQPMSVTVIVDNAAGRQLATLHTVALGPNS
jgi:general secretion pathway protein I